MGDAGRPDGPDLLELYLDCRRTAERCSLWFLRHRRPPVAIGAEVERFRSAFRELADELPGCLRGPMEDSYASMVRDRCKQGVPESLARRSSIWRLLHTTFDVIELAARERVTPVEAATVYWSLFDRLELLWLWDGIGALPRSDRWQTQARGSLRDDLLTALAVLAENVLDSPGRTVDAWWEANERSLVRALAQLTEIRRTDGLDITNLSVALRQLRNLAVTSVRAS